MLIVITILVGCRHSNLSHRWSRSDLETVYVWIRVCDIEETGDSDAHKLTVVALRVHFQHPALIAHSSIKRTHTTEPLQDNSLLLLHL